MNEPTTGTLDVPGATLHYEYRGRGPVLLLIPGGAADAGLYAAMTKELVTRYTVVSYDPRGLSRSRLDGPLTDQRVEVWSDDARRLLDLLAPNEEASVLGSSSGAIVALDLLARHPERLRRVVAHEPPLLELLPEPAPHRALFADVRETFRTQGVGAAMARFSEGLGGRPGDRATELPPEIQEMAPRMHANLPVFLEHILCPFSGSRPDVAALQRAADRLVLAVGRDSRTQEPLYGPATRLADLTGGKAVEFPGGHVGCTEHPKEFAQQLVEVL
ncbi:alpha/beta fold hydrolase [Streptomyces sp. NPDC059649]|uniref:alpha/beta fold hydrolase n=1 Tax=Streptomyces sp. NPDC059649 TaxID=3346895 RepID=UPI00368C6E2A